MIEVRSPGKLFIAGEYAVVEPGHPAVLVAVDRCVTVRLEPSENEGRVFSEQYGRAPVIWRRDHRGVVIGAEDRPLDHVLSAIRVVESLAAELGVAPRFSTLTITSELDDADGRKFGLGSSAAVTVATVRALDEFYRLDLSRTQILKLAILSTVDVNPAASGGDVAASVFGGWLRYSSPDRLHVRDVRHGSGVLAALRDPWRGLELDRLAPPSSLRLLVGWTGKPASTARLVDELQSRKWAESAHYTAFLADSRRAVDALSRGLNSDEPEQVLAAIHSARRTLVALGNDAGMDIETDALRALCDVADGHGGAAKSSGAGGGDCGIALLDRGTTVHEVEKAWAEAGIERLPLTVHRPTGIIDAVYTSRDGSLAEPPAHPTHHESHHTGGRASKENR
ncbi:phosphomevalonate kinase [Microbacteriaceae bacterium VKM Ac-2855]|nr:phosphomevalonate kinase [Microbacteriaceae bacterium VKM Ac-2855]